VKAFKLSKDLAFEEKFERRASASWPSVAGGSVERPISSWLSPPVMGKKPTLQAGLRLMLRLLK
jgi:hypothetical protein